MNHASKINDNVSFSRGTADSSNDIPVPGFSDLRDKHVSPGFSAEVTQKKRGLLSPEPLSSIDNLEKELTPRKNYIGPGMWLDLIREKGADKKTISPKKKDS